MAAFTSARDALHAAEHVHAAPVAIHTGDAHREGDHLAGAAVSRCRRLLELAGPGQILVSAPAAAAAGDGFALHDVGLHRLRDLSPPLRVFVLGAPGEVAPRPARRHAAQPPERADGVRRPRRRADGAARPTGGDAAADHRRPRRQRQVAAGRPARGRGGGEPAGRRVVGRAGRRRRRRRRWRRRWPRAVGVLVVPAQGAAASAARPAGRPPPAALPGQLRARPGRRGRAGRRPVRRLPGRDDRGHEPRAARPVRRDGVAAAAVVGRRRPGAVPRARGARRRTGEDAAIASMCTRLDGSPLALELAAAWAPTAHARPDRGGTRRPLRAAGPQPARRRPAPVEPARLDGLEP